MDESQFHREINHKLDRLVNLYKEDQDIDDAVRSKILNLQSRQSLDAKLGTGLLTTEDPIKMIPSENFFVSPNNQGENFFPSQQSPHHPSLNLSDPLASKEQTFNQSSFHSFPTARNNLFAFPAHISNPSNHVSNLPIHLSPPNFASSLPNINTYLDNKQSSNNLFSPASANLTNLTNLQPHDNNMTLYASSYGGLGSDEAGGSEILNLDRSITLRKTPTNNISSQLSEQISFLLYELKRLKDINNEISGQLASCKHELSETKNKLLMAESQMHSKSAQENLSTMVDNVYRSQKVRDVAVIDRLKIANQERDAAVMKANLLQQKILGNQNKDDIVSELMRSHSVDNLKKTTDDFVRMVKEEKGRRRRMVEEEMETLLVEKDLVHKQKGETERENKVLMEKLQNEFKKRKSMQEKQKMTERERDECMGKLKELYEELQKLKITYNLHGSLSKEKQLHQKYNVLLDGAQDEVNQRQKQVRALTQDKDELVGKVRVFQEDNQAMKRQTGHMQQQLQDELKEKEQLNRLVGVLRRKLAEG